MKFVFIALSLSLVCFTSCLTTNFSAKLIRKGFDKEGVTVNKALEKHTPSNISGILNEHYDISSKDTFLDVYYPTEIENSDKTLPTIVWIHGGAWIAGDKNQIGNYCKILASKGYTVVAVNYSLAPKEIYPTPVVQVNNALAYLKTHAKRLHIDTNHFVLAGDSGGAHIAAQLANLTTVASYASLLDIRPSIQRSQLAGVVLFCGPYDAKNVDLNGMFGKFLKIVLHSYSGSKHFLTDPRFESASVINYLTKDFPPTFISAGNVDPLLLHSYQLAQKLSDVGASNMETLFWVKEHTPVLPHEYQFNLDNEDGQLALKCLTEFLSNLDKKKK